MRQGFHAERSIAGDAIPIRRMARRGRLRTLDPHRGIVLAAVSKFAHFCANRLVRRAMEPVASIASRTRFERRAWP
jgi:hypothetical protein